MSLQLQATPPIPEGTARVTRTLFPKRNRYIHPRDELSTIFTHEHFAGVVSTRRAVWRTILADCPGRSYAI